MPGIGNTTDHAGQFVGYPSVDADPSDGPGQRDPLLPPPYSAGSESKGVTLATPAAESSGYAPPPSGEPVPPSYYYAAPHVSPAAAASPLPYHTAPHAPYPAYAQPGIHAQQQPHSGAACYSPAYPQQQQQDHHGPYYSPYGTSAGHPSAGGASVSQDQGFQLVGGVGDSVLSLPSPHAAGDFEKPHDHDKQQPCDQGYSGVAAAGSHQPATRRSRMLLCLSEAMLPLAVMDILMAVLAAGTVSCVGYRSDWWGYASIDDYFVTVLGGLGLLAALAFAGSRLVRLCCSLAAGNPGRVFHGFDCASHFIFAVAWIVAGVWTLVDPTGYLSDGANGPNAICTYVAGAGALIIAVLSLVVSVIAAKNFRRA